MAVEGSLVWWGFTGYQQLMVLFLAKYISFTFFLYLTAFGILKIINKCQKGMLGVEGFDLTF